MESVWWVFKQLWEKGLVYLGFLAWRADYLARAEFGATQVAPLVDPLAESRPPDLAPAAWRAVASLRGSVGVSAWSSTDPCSPSLAIRSRCDCG